MLGEAKDELAKIKKCKDNTQALRDRFESDFGRLRTEPYQIPKKEGKWESFTTNRPSTEAYRIINTLAKADLKLKILLSDEDEKKRKDLSKTERFPYGAIALRDSIHLTIPESLPLHASMSSLAPLRGWLGLLCYLHEKDDGKNGKVVPHIAVWDIFNTYWISGAVGLLWAAYMRYASPEDVKEQYGEDLRPDMQGRIKLYDVWGRVQHGVIAEEEWLQKVDDHNCGHLPALILPGGSIPLIQSALHTDTIKNVGESWCVNNRHLYDIESRLGSYYLTMSGRAAKTPMAHEWDSTKTTEFPALQDSPFQKGSEVPIDIGKGEKLVPLTVPEMTRDAYAMWEYVKERLAVGDMSPTDLSEIRQAGPAAGLNIHRHVSLDKLEPPKKLMERSYEWLAHELVSQYKNGSFEKIELQGLDGLNRRFKMKVSPKDIDDSWNFEAKLIVDLPQDDMANMGMATQAKAGKLLSDETIRDRFLHVPDTDLEQEKVDREDAYNTFFINARKLAAVLKDKGDEEGAQIILEDIEQIKMQREKERETGVASQPGIPSPVRPSADTSAVTPQPPEGKGLRKFLSRFGVAK